MNAINLVLAMLLDAAVGEPRWIWNKIPHPVIIIRRLIDRLDNLYYKGTNRKLKGVVLLIGLCLTGVLIGTLIALLPFGWLFEVILAAVFLAQRSLVQHVRAVSDALRLSVSDGQSSVAMIVGRDAGDLNRAYSR